MSERIGQVVKEFRAYTRRMKDYTETIGVMSWDMRTGAPKKGLGQRSEVIGTLSGDLFKMSISPEMKAFLDVLAEPDTYGKLDPITKGIVRECKKEYEKSHAIPPELYQEYVVLTNKSESAWEDARKNNDFASFRPYLEKILEYTNRFLEIWGYKGHKYNTLLDHYEPGMTVETLDSLFDGLRLKTVDLLKEIQERGQATNPSFLEQHFRKEEQRRFSHLVLQRIGYDFDAGRLDESAHPFATGLNPGDVRITTRYDENDFRTAIFSTIHEAGHAIYEQNISAELIGTLLSDGTSMGIHESQSRFLENIIGRSHEFWSCFFDDLLKFFPRQFQGVSLEQFFRAINQVQPSLIRVEADELTYNLHIMLRYELEKALIGGDLTVAELPGAWEEKMKDYLGVVPPNDADGVLQDVHWSFGAFGYFPSYSLGNIYAAQFEAALLRDVPDYREAVRSGEFGVVKKWLTDNIHKHGKLLEPKEILESVTGEAINSGYLVRYLEDKYTQVYNL
ncbi:carboxypeptidase M32 [Effusibacillus lacus]|uniref:Metal-dependent carboxypeptidase n=1 Tax=Effusibacillus lacus TaxID=1348429 RepID=A0A292YJB3_9BACL|nr:carboxypeptidase M32 [Effusibacillus lacus]TCS74601.1 carboxypeptidase Taq [Effusibacillus lacus]GAX88474.1 peptidase M32 [Effusibacillus lacus]